MQTRNPFLDDLAQLVTTAMGAAQGVSDEAQSMVRAQVERMASDFDLVRRDEFEALKDEIAALRAEVAVLREAASDGKPPADTQ